MTKTMLTAYRVNAADKNVELVEFEKGNIKQIQGLIGCSCFTSFVSSVFPDYTFYIDDEGLWSPERAWWKVEGYEQPITGTALFVKTDSQGYSQSADIPMVDLAEKIRFIDLMKINGRIVEFIR